MIQGQQQRAYQGGQVIARRSGRVPGRPRALRESQRRHIRDEVLAGRATKADMMREYRVNRPTVDAAVRGP